MTVETAVYLNTLDSAKPANTELVSEGDDHLRLLKSVLKATFPGRGLAEKQPVSKTITFAPGLDEVSVLFLANGATQANLPAISGLANGTHYWFWAEDNDLTLTTLDTALVNGAATLLLEQGTGACVIYTGTGWVAVGLGGGSGEQVNLIEGDYIAITGTYPDLTIAALPLNPTYDAPLSITGSYPDIHWQIANQPKCVFKTTKTDNQTITTGAVDKILWNDVIYDTEGALASLAHTFIAPYEGYYQVNVTCAFQEASDHAHLYLYVNGLEGERFSLHNFNIDGAPNFQFTAHLSTIILLLVDDTLDVRAQAQGSSQLLIGTESRFSGHFIPLGLSGYE